MTELAAAVDAALDSAVAEGRIAGAVALVSRAGAPAYARAVGLAEIESNRPMTEDTIFRASSLTKPIVSAAAMALAEAGVIGLSDPVTKYLPDFWPQWGGEAPPITLEQLLTHTAGLSYGFLQPEDGPYLRAGVSDGMDQPGLSMAENLRRIVEAGLTFPPGAAWLYSVGLDVLGGAIEAATGKTLGEVVAERVTGKLGMADTGFTTTKRERLAMAYADGPPPVRMGERYTVPFMGLSGIRFAPDRLFDSGSFPSGGAGAVTTGPDMMKLLEAIRSGGGAVVRRETAQAMMNNQTGALAIVTNGPGFGFGYGGAVLVDPAAAASVHGAGTWLWGGVYGHSWFVDPTRQTSAVLMTNTSVEGLTGQLSTDFAAAVAANT